MRPTMPAVLCDSMPSTAFVSGASSLVGAEQRFWSAIPDDRSDISEEEELDQDFEQVRLAGPGGGGVAVAQVAHSVAPALTAVRKA